MNREYTFIIIDMFLYLLCYITSDSAHNRIVFIDIETETVFFSTQPAFCYLFVEIVLFVLSFFPCIVFKCNIKEKKTNRELHCHNQSNIFFLS
jgi:hypothetical protein